MSEKPTIADEVAAALAMLDDDPEGITLSLADLDVAQVQEAKHYSQTLARLDASRRPSEETICETCPHSLWFSSKTEVKCYCRVMYLVTWSTAAQTTLSHCDGVFIGKD